MKITSFSLRNSEEIRVDERSKILECDRTMKAFSFVERNKEDCVFTSLQNWQKSGASAIQERARETQERARSARQEISACKHTIVYPLPTVRLANGFC